MPSSPGHKSPVKGDMTPRYWVTASSAERVRSARSSILVLREDSVAKPTGFTFAKVPQLTRRQLCSCPPPEALWQGGGGSRERAGWCLRRNGIVGGIKHGTCNPHLKIPTNAPRFWSPETRTEFIGTEAWMVPRLGIPNLYQFESSSQSGVCTALLVLRACNDSQAAVNLGDDPESTSRFRVRGVFKPILSETDPFPESFQCVEVLAVFRHLEIIQVLASSGPRSS
ncbi:hypothetical protein C8R46DRAFT_1044152 [Mycena filopes]|nr:hypothetical protein C8R46DRAFT_1044152 [Mycena filopes]